ncbi:energy-coupled thiamine transporter ThiT [Liberiplasma polymorphum]|uniref:energy-coupled thiamine transporter ThiT n=1 Tax=Liberiplasma polymorphum TaxID=3374570 RepID=UPI003776275D
MKNKSLSTRQITEVAILLAIAIVLELIAMALPKMPQGGSFSISMLPIFIIALRHGAKIGIMSGVLYGILDLMLNGFVLWHWASFFLDYTIAFGLLGVAGYIFARKKESPTYFAVGIIIGSLLRFMSHWLSGVMLFAPSGDQGFLNYRFWIGSAVYNATYMIPSTIFTVVIGFVLFTALKDQLINTQESL